ncbi:MAG: stress response translation initiation inhibitor YciH [Planctomycetota bacterium]|nr:MAG: stress response translation initiation inhibitor YciH [Planctomycetota bacterium]
MSKKSFRKPEKPAPAVAHKLFCPAHSFPESTCLCGALKKQAAEKSDGGDGVVRVSRATQGRKGKGVTLIHGLPLEPEALKKLAKQLKQRCGSGGSIRDGVIEIQGEHRDVLVEELRQMGWKVKRVGG